MNKEAFKKSYKNSLGRLIPEYAIASLPFLFIVNNIVYFGSQQLMKNANHYDFTTKLDEKTPFIKEWVAIYLICYLFWIVNYILIAREGKEKWFRFATGDLLSRLLCGLFFILLPTTNVRPEVIGSDVFSYLMRIVYTQDLPLNLFPSIHCLVSWLSFIGIRGSKKVPKWYQYFSCIFAILIFLSTQFTKQHIWIDMFGGVLFAEACIYFANKTSYYHYIEAFFDKIEIKLFGETYDKK